MGSLRLVLSSLILLAGRTAGKNSFAETPRITDLDQFNARIQMRATAPKGRLWSYPSRTNVTLTVSNMKAGLGLKPGASAQCRVLGMNITNVTFQFTIATCGFSLGATYRLNSYVESATGGTLYQENFTVPREPEPFPFGPYCFDIDADYFGAKVAKVFPSVPDAEGCQALCQANATCLHFRYIYSRALPAYQNCSLLSTGPVGRAAEASQGVITGPKDCKSRSVLYWRPQVSAVSSVPSWAVRETPFTIVVRGIYFDPGYDRIVLMPYSQKCGERAVYGPVPTQPASKWGNYTGPRMNWLYNISSTPGDVDVYYINGTNPSTMSGWAALVCNGTGTSIFSDVSVLVCGAPPATVLFAHVLGRVRVCICDAGVTPFGCQRPEHFDITPILGYLDYLDITGPYEGQTAFCAVGRTCTLNGLGGYLSRPGDRMMLRANCSNASRASVRAFTNASLPSPPSFQGIDPWANRAPASTFIFDEPNTATCPPGQLSGPCDVARMCYCPAADIAEYPCADDSHYTVDAGQVIFFPAPSAPGSPIIIQEDFESFTIRWTYPSYDGGIPVNNYSVYFSICPGGFQTPRKAAKIVVRTPLGADGKPATNATYYFHSVSFVFEYVDLQPATRYCVTVTAVNDAGESDPSPMLAWVTDVRPPRIQDYAALGQPPVVLDVNASMPPMQPTVLVDDCTLFPSVLNGYLNASECNVQIFEIEPPLPRGLQFDSATGRISGTPLDVQTRPQIFRVTATNTGGKSSYYISLATRSKLTDTGITMCLSTQTVNDAVVTFRTRREVDGSDLYARYAANPMTLRITILDARKAAIYQTSGLALGYVPRAGSVPCGFLITDTWSSSPRGFPPPVLCHWNAPVGQVALTQLARMDIDFQGNATFEADAWYQFVLRLRVSETVSEGDALLRLEMFASEATSAEGSGSSEAFGSWAPVQQLPRWRRELDLSRPTPLRYPLKDAPWTNGRPTYQPGFRNPLLGQAPTGYPYPWGFPEPGITECYNCTSYCPTSPHYFENGPEGSAWYNDTDADTGMFPGFSIAAGVAVMLRTMGKGMQYNPFATFDVVALPRRFVSLAQKQPVYVDQEQFTVQFALNPQVDVGVTLERGISICPSSPLQMPFMADGPACVVSDGPSYVDCTCNSTMSLGHPSGAARCDRIELRVQDSLEVRMTVTATLLLQAGRTPAFAGFVPIKWAAELKTKAGGLFSFIMVASAGLNIFSDTLIENTTPQACAQVCLSRLTVTPGASFQYPCRSFKFQRVQKDCYLSRFARGDPGVTLQTDITNSPYDYYEYFQQQFFSVPSARAVFFNGLLLASATLRAATYLEPPPPTPPPFDVPHFFPSYVGQLYLVYAIQLVPAVPVHGQSPWRGKVAFLAPAGFRPIALQAQPDAIPTPQGFGYCAGENYTCDWLLSQGQVLWPQMTYSFTLTVHNPVSAIGAVDSWYAQVISAGLVPEGSLGVALPVEMPQPLLVDSPLRGCSASYALLAPRPVAVPQDHALELYFVLERDWRSGATLQVTLPVLFPVPAACQALPLTPYIQPAHISCSRSGSRGVAVVFDFPLPNGTSIGLRLSPFDLPDDYAALRLGYRSWPLSGKSVQPASVNVRLTMLPAADPGADPRHNRYACHPAVWSCGKYPDGWAEPAATIRPSRYAFTSLQVVYEHSEPFLSRTAWARVQFSVNETVVLDGSRDAVLVISPPFGFSLVKLYSSNLYVMQQTDPNSQLSMPTVVGLTSAAQLPQPVPVLRVAQMSGRLSPGGSYFVNVSFRFPDSGLEPSVFAEGQASCANVWGVGLQSSGMALASGITPGQPLAYISSFQVECTTRASGAVNLLAVSFTTTSRQWGSDVPAGSDLVLALTLPGHFELRDPALAADFIAPFAYNRSTDAPLFGTAGPEVPQRQKLGCPPVPAFSKGRRLRTQVSGCAVAFNDLEDQVDFSLLVPRLPAGATHEFFIRVRNPARKAAGSGKVGPSFSMSLFRTTEGSTFDQIPLPATVDGSGVLFRLQAAMEVAGTCDPLLPIMQAEMSPPSCLLVGKETEISVGFLIPTTLLAPVPATLRSPPGFLFPWICDFQVDAVPLPSGRAADQLDDTKVANCSVSEDGRSIHFIILKNLRAKVVWNYFNVHLTNPPAAAAPLTREQSSWSLEVGGFAAGSASGAAGLAGPKLQTFLDLELRELPFTYNATSWPLALRLRVASPVPPGGYVTVRAPRPFSFPALQCRGASSSGAPPAGSPLFVPALRASPFQMVQEASDMVTPPPGPQGLMQAYPTRASCSVTDAGQLLAIAVLQGTLPAGLYELRFATALDPALAPELLAKGESSSFAPLLWTVESWHPAGSKCFGSCCPDRRANFRVVVGIMELELLDRGVVEAYPTGQFSGRRVVPNDYGGWRFSDDDPNSGASNSSNSTGR